MDDPELWKRVREEMGEPSGPDLTLRGRKDTIGFGEVGYGEVLDRVWDLALAPPSPDVLGPAPGLDRPARGLIAPHDDYVYAGRVYRRVFPLLSARTVIVIGVLHQWRRFDLRSRLVFDPYHAWSTTEGAVATSPLRDRMRSALPERIQTTSAMIHDCEHSVEALLPWIKNVQPEAEIVPVLVGPARFEELVEMAAAFAYALGEALDERGWVLGKDVAIAISADAIHYGADFQQTRFGPGGPEAYAQARALDHALLTGPLAGPVTREKIRAAYETWVDPEHPANYRWTWCGRFSIPFGLLVLEQLGGAHGWPLAYATSAGSPELPLYDLGFGITAPADYGHFVGYPAAAYTAPLAAKGGDS